jgi:plasmid rolling circle replication initiator protein Rep
MAGRRAESPAAAQSGGDPTPVASQAVAWLLERAGARQVEREARQARRKRQREAGLTGPAGTADPSCFNTAVTTSGKLPDDRPPALVAELDAGAPAPDRKPKNPALAAALEEDPEFGRWNYHKRHARRLERQLNRAGLGHTAARVGWCSECLVYGLNRELEDGRLGRAPLIGQQTCGFRFCPMCQARRASEWGVRLREALPAATAELGEEVCHLTLTIRNVPLEQLRAAIDDLHEALKRFTSRAKFAATGWVRNTEVTVNHETYEAHPHIHLLLFMRPGYFAAPWRKEKPAGGGRPRIVPGYMTAEEYWELWQECARLDYAPSIRIQRVRLDTTKGQRAIYEVTKYGMKPAELTSLPAHLLPTLIEQLRGVRTIGVGGALRAFVREPDDEDQDAPEPPRVIGAVVQWAPGARRYVYRELGGRVLDVLPTHHTPDGDANEPEWIHHGGDAWEPLQRREPMRWLALPSIEHTGPPRAIALPAAAAAAAARQVRAALDATAAIADTLTPGVDFETYEQERARLEARDRTARRAAQLRRR